MVVVHSIATRHKGYLFTVELTVWKSSEDKAFEPKSLSKILAQILVSRQLLYSHAYSGLLFVSVVLYSYSSDCTDIQRCFY